MLDPQGPDVVGNGQLVELNKDFLYYVLEVRILFADKRIEYGVELRDEN